MISLRDRMKTYLTPEPPIDNITDLKSWLMLEYAELCFRYNKLCENPMRNSIHERRLELIKVGRKVGIELAPPSLERKLKEEKGE
jgi:hypothetical protein